jgi:hypothetical protein
MKTLRAALAIAFFISATAVPAFAWGKTWMGAALELAVRQAAWKFRPFRMQPALNLRDAGYDSNVYYGATDEPVKDLTFISICRSKRR